MRTEKIRADSKLDKNYYDFANYMALKWNLCFACFLSCESWYFSRACRRAMMVAKTTAVAARTPAVLYTR